MIAHPPAGLRTIIAGSRGINDYEVVERAIYDSGFDIAEVLSGCARGVDRLGEIWAQHANVPVRRFPADWNAYGRRAGYIRNAEMASNADALIAIWDGRSPGTSHMIHVAHLRDLRIHVFIPKQGGAQ